jgi:hypothetical protein|tara:strand:- start:1071 stop:1373 length:303 start_codon:yes stop_codon:yes gene_type:complete
MNVFSDKVKEVFNDIFFADEVSDKVLVTDQVQLEEKVWMFDRWSPYKSPLSWSDAISKFKGAFTKEELELISFKFESEEYADVEEHDEEREHRTLTIRIK